MIVPEPGELYRHFKGGIYRIIATGKHSETDEAMVCYRSEYNPNSVWFRPLSMWFDEVEYEGKKVTRFTKVIPSDYPIGTTY
jgi:uncharacterized protein